MEVWADWESVERSTVSMLLFSPITLNAIVVDMMTMVMISYFAMYGHQQMQMVIMNDDSQSCENMWLPGIQ